jgi:hypothetical protein
MIRECFRGRVAVITRAARRIGEVIFNREVAVRAT